VDPGGLIVILGPTATGKTEVALRLARRLNGRVIGADSIQVYRRLDAGSCKPTAQARREVPHDLIDVADPGEAFSAGRFARMAAESIAAARSAGQVPIVAGGTGLYLRALLQGIAPMPQRDEQLRRELNARAAVSPPGALHRELETLDPVTARRTGPNDLQRIVRALEVIRLSGVPLSRHLSEHAFATDVVPAMKIGLMMERECLYQRVNERVERIFEAGIVQEVADLIASGIAPDANALKALGYREVMSHLRGEIDLARTVDLVKRNTRRYARRQILWFKREPDVRWFDAGAVEPEAVAEAVAGSYETQRLADTASFEQRRQP
jgi:tRNA dimethylallyltransferase